VGRGVALVRDLFGADLHPKTYRCRANMAQIIKSRPDSGLCFQAQFLTPFSVDPSSLGSGFINKKWVVSYKRGIPVWGRFVGRGVARVRDLFDRARKCALLPCLRRRYLTLTHKIWIFNPYPLFVLKNVLLKIVFFTCSQPPPPIGRFVGRGAARVRDLFDRARKCALLPCLRRRFSTSILENLDFGTNILTYIKNLDFGIFRVFRTPVLNSSPHLAGLWGGGQRGCGTSLTGRASAPPALSSSTSWMLWESTAPPRQPRGKS